MLPAAPPQGPAPLGEQPPDPKNPKAWDAKSAEDILDAALAEATDKIRPGERDRNRDRDRDRYREDRDRDFDRNRDRSHSRNRSRDGGRDYDRETGAVVRRKTRSGDRGRDRRSRSRRGDRDRSRRGDRDRDRRSRSRRGDCDRSRRDRRGDYPTQGSSAGGSARSERKTKWGEGDKEELPEWLMDAPEQKPPPVDDNYFRIITLYGRQVRALIGVGGETIKDIRMRSGASVEINSAKHEWEGKVHIVGNVEKALEMIKEALSVQGCPLGKPVKPPGGWGPNGPPKSDPPEGEQATGPGGIPLAEVLKNALQEITTNADGDVEVPADLISPLVGPGGQTIKEIRDQAGGDCFISVLPNPTLGPMQAVRCTGENSEKAKALLIAKIEEIKLERAATAVRASSGGVVRPSKNSSWVGPGGAGDDLKKPPPEADTTSPAPAPAQAPGMHKPNTSTWMSGNAPWGGRDRDWSAGREWTGGHDFFSGGGGGFSSSGGGFSSSPPVATSTGIRPTTVQSILSRR